MALHSMNLARKMVGMDVRLSLQGINSLHTSSRMQMGFGSHSSDNDPDVIHEEKEKHLSGKSKHIHPGLEEGWSEKLSSDSEAAVKAERHGDGEASIEDLQKKTVEHVRQEHHGDEEPISDPSKAGKTSQ